MSRELLDPLRHNSWATRRLLAFCRDLSDEDLAASVPGTFGSVLATFNHILDSEASYYFRITERRPNWDWRLEEIAEITALEARASEMATLWEDLLRDPVDVDRTVTARTKDGTAYAVPVGVVLAQTLNHGNEHRAHICAILSALGRRPPDDIDGWGYGIASGRAVPRTGGEASR